MQNLLGRIKFMLILKKQIQTNFEKNLCRQSLVEVKKPKLKTHDKTKEKTLITYNISKENRCISTRMQNQNRW